MNRVSHPSRRRFLQCSAAAFAAGVASPLWLPEAVAARETYDESVFAKKKLIVHGKSPYNAEPELGDLVEKWITPTRYFYVRNHAPVPKIDEAGFRVSVEGLVEKPLKLSLKELTERFESTAVTATLTCAGNRRSEHSRFRKVGGVQWREGAIGNAKWEGVRLADVLKSAGLKPEAKHVWFEGLDEIDHKGRTIGFGGSIPIEKALLAEGGVPGAILCQRMNGEPLAPEHGFPLRTVVPGYIGARSVKWLGKIVVSDRPSPNHYLATAYKLVIDGTPLEWNEAGPIYTCPLNSAICSPASGAKHAAGKVRVAGFALPPGRSARPVRSVEVSTDGGRRFTAAKITSPKQPYCWVLWSAEVDVGPKTTELIVRATDSAGNRQPRRSPWNLKGYMYNGWHHVEVGVN